MTYRVEITADTLYELSGKVSALAAKLHATQPMASSFDVRSDERMMTSVDLKAFMGEGTSVADPGTQQPVTQQPDGLQAAEIGPAPEPVAEAAPARAYDYNADIAPRVLELVDKRGRETAERVLASFGVKRAVHLDPSRFGDLLDAISAAMEG